MAKEVTLAHLEWAIDSRTKNQKSCLKLLMLLREYESFWKAKALSKAAQDLIAVAFSLWRAAFLADKTGKREEVLKHGVAFLEKVIETNSISFGQDKNSNEWTFNYYTKNARSSLTILARNWDFLSPYEGGTRKAIERWDYCQALLDQALVKFESHLGDKKATSDRIKQKRVRGAEAKARRARSRQTTE